MPLKLDTEVGNRGIRLSGGQKQRIGISRALYTNKKILFLDEATNSLDASTENKILENIFQLKDLTIIMITHKLETLKNLIKFI